MGGFLKGFLCILSSWLVKAPSTAITTVGGVSITLGGLKEALALFEAIPTASLARIVTNAGDLSNDTDVAELVAQTLAADGVPYAGDAALALNVIRWIVANNSASTQGTPITPAHHGAGR